MTPEISRAMKLHQAGQLAEAATIYDRALRDNPHDIDALHLLGLIAFQMGDYAQSDRLIGEALRLNPKPAVVNHNMGSTQRVLGNFDRARHHYRLAIEARADYAEAYFNLSAVTRFRNDETSFIDAIEKLLERSAIAPADRCFLHFAAGKYYDDVERYDEAFAHFRQGNECSGAVFDREAYQARVDAIIETADAEFCRRRQDFGHHDAAPVFIVGMPRSGSTLIEQILASHPDVHGAGELPDINGIIQALQQQAPDNTPYPRCLLSATKAMYAGFGAAYVKRTRSLGGNAKRVVDKNLLNHQHLGLILTMLPKAKVIHCSRYALDTALSCYFQKFQRSQEFSYSFEGIASYYHGYRRLMEHWKTLAPQRIIDMEYEAVVDNVEREARALVDFLELPWDDRCLRFHETRRAVVTASDSQVRRTIYTSSVRRSDHYTKHIDQLRALLGD